MKKLLNNEYFVFAGFIVGGLAMFGYVWLMFEVPYLGHITVGLLGLIFFAAIMTEELKGKRNQ